MQPPPPPPYEANDLVHILLKQCTVELEMNGVIYSPAYVYRHTYNSYTI